MNKFKYDYRYCSLCGTRTTISFNEITNNKDDFCLNCGEAIMLMINHFSGYHYEFLSWWQYANEKELIKSECNNSWFYRKAAEKYCREHPNKK